MSDTPSVPELAERLRERVQQITSLWEKPENYPPFLISIDEARLLISALEELSRLKAETPDNGDRSGHDLPEALREFMADRGRLLAYGDADLIREAIDQLSRLKAGEGVELPDSDTIQRWVALAYREPEDLSRRDDFRFTRWNMEVAFMAGFDFARGETEHMPRPLPPAPGGRSDE